MRKIYLLLFFSLFSIGLLAQEPFITTWKTTSDKESITIPTTGEGYNYSVDWGDGSSDIGFTGDATHEYEKAGTYTVSVSGDFPRIFFKYDSDRNKVMTIEQWGDIRWTSMESAFRGCENLTYNAVDAPDLSNVTDMSYMFYNAHLFNGDLNMWNVSSVTNMRKLFAHNTNSENAFNGNISDWDVSSVTNMESMFQFATSFNVDISKWKVGSVTNMRTMFSDAHLFNADISSWDVSKVTDMGLMFNNAESFNGNLSEWDVSNVTNMNGMFRDADIFNGDISKWNVSNVELMWGMFRGATSFNGNISSWDISNVTNMTGMFLNATTFNQDLSNWNISNVTDMEFMFDESGLSLQNYDKIINGWASLNNLQDTVILGAKSLATCDSRAARDILIKKYGWTINDEGHNCKFQRIEFDELKNKRYKEDRFILEAKTSSGLPVSYISSDSKVATISSDTVTIEGIGSAKIIAFQEGNENYDPADSVTRELIVLKANQEIIFDSIPPQAYWASNVTLDGTSNSGLTVSYLSSEEEVAIIIDNREVDLISEGSTIITAYQEGNENYNPADSVTRELLVVKNTVTAVKDIENLNIQIYPNPTKDFIYLNNVDNYNYARLYNEEGKLIHQQNLESDEVKIDIQNQLEGVYFIRLDNQKEVFKVMKK